MYVVGFFLETFYCILVFAVVCFLHMNGCFTVYCVTNCNVCALMTDDCYR